MSKDTMYQNVGHVLNGRPHKVMSSVPEPVVLPPEERLLKATLQARKTIAYCNERLSRHSYAVPVAVRQALMIKRQTAYEILETLDPTVGPMTKIR